VSIRTAQGVANLPGVEAQRGVVGPNAVLQLHVPVRAAGGDSLLQDVFRRAGLSHYLVTPPLAMVPQEEARRLFGAVREFLGPDGGDAVLREAGAGTAAYVMANRIPAVARSLLRVLPPRPAARLLLTAIQRHAWTFAGSGLCNASSMGKTAVLEIEHNPLATPGCAWHAGVLETMFQRLVSPRTTLRHTSCEARNGDRCRFELLLP
jgi:divinyl protochlorophyllide a 8-vinyl-reductase